MAILLDQRKENFCHLYLNNGGSARAAAIDAGYAIASAHNQGSKLLKNPEIQDRLRELQKAAQADTEIIKRVNREWVMSRMVVEAEKASRSGDRIRALHLVGMEMGLFTERKMEITNPLDGLTADQLLALLRVAEDMQRQAGIEHQPKPSSTMIAHTPEPEYIEAETIPSDDDVTPQEEAQEMLKDH